MKAQELKLSNSKGFTLIELMVAMVIGLIVMLGLISLFTSSSTLNRAQNGLSVLQENGRYAIGRIKQDLESAGRKHCSTVAMPNEFTTNWNQGYAMTPWMVSDQINFTGTNFGLPLENSIELGPVPNIGQLPVNGINSNAYDSYPLDPRYFIHGHECTASSCQPALNDIGADVLTGFRSLGATAGSQARNTDIVTVRYLTGGSRVTQFNNVNGVMANNVNWTSPNAILADCDNTFVTPVTWGANNFTTPASTSMPNFNIFGDTKIYSMDDEMKQVSYFVGVDQDPNDTTRLVSSLYRSENGNVQQLVEGVERFDVFYLAQLQTGRVARLTADQINTVQGGGSASLDSNVVTGDNGCILPPDITSNYGNISLANGPGCLWRSIYAIEVHLLLNTVNSSSVNDEDRFIYTPDGLTPQIPTSGLPSGLPADRMYRREFTSIVPVRSYSL